MPAKRNIGFDTINGSLFIGFFAYVDKIVNIFLYPLPKIFSFSSNCSSIFWDCSVDLSIFFYLFSKIRKTMVSYNRFLMKSSAERWSCDNCVFNASNELNFCSSRSRFKKCNSMFLLYISF